MDPLGTATSVVAINPISTMCSTLSSFDSEENSNCSKYHTSDVKHDSRPTVVQPSAPLSLPTPGNGHSQ